MHLVTKRHLQELVDAVRVADERYKRQQGDATAPSERLLGTQTTLDPAFEMLDPDEQASLAALIRSARMRKHDWMKRQTKHLRTMRLPTPTRQSKPLRHNCRGSSDKAKATAGTGGRKELQLIYSCAALLYSATTTVRNNAAA